ncbi:MAG: GNAT family N-acetyltransferase, partial [Clostridia bacterium]|nr:GNAT family N-acetyltransferase [Clostridia bacterium]
LLRDWIFEKRKAKVNLAFCDGAPAGFTLYCFNFSTFLGRAGIWLEDLFVLPEYRGQGIGLSLMRTLAREAVDGGFGRFEWSCLDWNTPSIGFYKQLGAVAMDEWTTYRLTGDALIKLAEGE